MKHFITASTLFLGMMGFWGTGMAQEAAAAPVPIVKDPYTEERALWNKPFKPFHIIGDVYYVGTANVAVFLITTPKGDILIDGGLQEGAPLIEKSIGALGFNIRDIKILLNSHAHFDHAGGLAELKQKSGAHLYASAADKPILEAGRISYGPSANTLFPPVKVDRVVKDGETISLGGIDLTAHLTPGHTPGCTTWTMPMKAAGVNHHVIFLCGINGGNPLVGKIAHPHIVEEYRGSFARLEKMDADVFLAPHGNQFGLDAKVMKMKEGAPNPFVDPSEFHTFVTKKDQDFEADLAKQTAQQKAAAH